MYKKTGKYLLEKTYWKEPNKPEKILNTDKQSMPK